VRIAADGEFWFGIFVGHAPDQVFEAGRKPEDAFYIQACVCAVCVAYHSVCVYMVHARVCAGDRVRVCTRMYVYV
jgi:hypothetical protein